MMLFCAAAVVALAAARPAASQPAAQDRVTDSRWSAAAPLVDGRAEEWKDDRKYDERSAEVECAFRNDGRDLYILLLFRNPKVLKPLEATGIAVFAGPAADGRPATGVRFIEKRMKADDYIRMLEGRGTPPSEAEKKELRAEKRHSVFFAVAVDRKGRTLVPADPASGVLPPGFAAAREDGRTVYEFRLPLAARTVSSAGIGASPGDALVVEFQWGGKGDRFYSVDTNWREAGGQISSGSPITGTGETSAQNFLSMFDRMSRPTTGGEFHAFALIVRLAEPQAPGR